MKFYTWAMAISLMLLSMIAFISAFGRGQGVYEYEGKKCSKRFMYNCGLTLDCTDGSSYECVTAIKVIYE